MTDSYSLGDPVKFDTALRASNETAAPGMVADQMYFPGFQQKFIRTSGAIINVLVAGSGPPLLLLHGHPETHIAWHKITSELAKRFTVVLTDMRGYGDSSKPEGSPDHIHYSKREMGLDQVEVMRALGFSSFQAIGHDRGGRVLVQMLRDHPQTVERAVVLDIAPTTAMYQLTNQEFATKYFWWFFHIQPTPLPEDMINASTELYLIAHLSDQNKTPGAVTPEAFAEYLRCYLNPACIHAVCEDYRASVTIDVAIEQEFIGQKIKQPLLALWGAKGTIGQLFNVLGLWQDCAEQVIGYSLPCGHLIPEEDPADLLVALNNFLRL